MEQRPFENNSWFSGSLRRVVHHTTRRNDPENHEFYLHRRENLKPPSKANSRLGSQGIPRLSWNPKVHYRVHKSPPLYFILNHMNPHLHTKFLQGPF